MLYSWQTHTLNNTKYFPFRWSLARQSHFIVYFKTGTFIVATNKQMVDLTYLCFVFLNDRSDAWWEMQWAACQGRDNSRERARESCIHSQFTPISAVFKVSNFFFFLHYYWLLREQLFPSLLPFRITILTLTDRQLMGKLTACMRRSNSAMKLMCCIKGNLWQSSGKWRRSRFKHSLGSAWTGSERARWSGPLRLNVGFIKSDPSCVSFFLYLFINSVIY